MIRPGTAIAVALVLVAACGTAATPGPASGDTELVVFAAASLSRPMEAIRSAWEADHPQATLSIATDGSAALRTQIEQGAEADVFLAAATTHPAALETDGLTLGKPVVFANNVLTVIVPADNPAGIDSAADLARPNIRIAAAGRGVPLTAYAAEALDRLSRLPGYPRAFADAVEANVVSREDNASAVVTRVELREVDAAIVYRTDALGREGVAAVPLPEGANVTAAYAGVVVRAARSPDAARALLDWIAGPRGGAILGRHGFLAASP